MLVPFYRGWSLLNEVLLAALKVKDWKNQINAQFQPPRFQRIL